jgi:hypothetical protein
MVYLPQVSPPKPCTCLSWSIRATFPAHLILLKCIRRIKFDEDCRSLSFSLRSFHHSTLTSSLLDPNILLDILFSTTISLLTISIRSKIFRHKPPTFLRHVLRTDGRTRCKRFAWR